MEIILQKTISLCEVCYRHVKAYTFENNGSIWLHKECNYHGSFTTLLEKKASFYYDELLNNSLISTSQWHEPDGVIIEVTDRCNLTCPHCYHKPDNTLNDQSIDSILTRVNNFPSYFKDIILAGAEPTVRKDLFELCNRIIDNKRRIILCTNGVKLSNLDYTKQLKEMDVNNNVAVSISLNHPNYQGKVVHAKILEGIRNCLKLQLKIHSISYTLETYDDLNFVLNEIQELGRACTVYRLSGGANIGRCLNELNPSLSKFVEEMFKVVHINKWSYYKTLGTNLPNLYMVEINGITHQIVKWSDVTSIDMEASLQFKGGWTNFVPDKPITQYLHQIILRDRVINNKQPLYDTVSKRYWSKPISNKLL